MLGYGDYLFVCWVRIHVSDVYYADYSYATAALVWTGIGLLSFGATWYGTWRRSFYGLLFAIPVFLGLASMVTIPNVLPHTITLVADTNYIGTVTNSLRAWYENRQRFPADDLEFREAMARTPTVSQYPAAYSRYKQRGNSLPYVIVVAHADGPRVANVSSRPGVIYYSVSSDLQEFWVTMTEVESDLASTASLRELTWWEKRSWIHVAGHDYPIKKQ